MALTGQELFGFFAYAANFTGGVRVATADINDDGQADVDHRPRRRRRPPCARLRRTHRRRRSGTSWPLRPRSRAASRVATGDVNLDGRAEIIVGTEGGPGRAVSVFDGATGGIVPGGSFNFPANSAFQGGVRVAAGDVNADGRADVVIANGPGNTPRVTVRDLAQTGATSSAISSPMHLPSAAASMWRPPI